MQRRLRFVRTVGTVLVAVGVVWFLWAASFGSGGRGTIPYRGLAYAAVGPLLLVVHRFVAGEDPDAVPLDRRVDAILLTTGALGTAHLLWGPSRIAATMRCSPPARSPASDSSGWCGDAPGPTGGPTRPPEVRPRDVRPWRAQPPQAAASAG